MVAKKKKEFVGLLLMFLRWLFELVGLFSGLVGLFSGVVNLYCASVGFLFGPGGLLSGFIWFSHRLSDCCLRWSCYFLGMSC